MFEVRLSLEHRRSTGLNIVDSGIYYHSTENLNLLKHHRSNARLLYHLEEQDLVKLGCFLTYEQALILVDFADPEYEAELTALVTVQDIICHERLQTLIQSRIAEISWDEFSGMVLLKREV